MDNVNWFISTKNSNNFISIFNWSWCKDSNNQTSYKNILIYLKDDFVLTNTSVFINLKIVEL